MRSDGITTEKGTFLPFLNLKGKNYLQVMHRWVWFRERHPIPEGWIMSVRSTAVEITADYALFKAEVVGHHPESPEQLTVFATAHKREDGKHFGDYIEKAESGAEGRALAKVGFGAQFAPELDEGARLVDAPAPIVAKPPNGGVKPWL